MKCPNCNRKVGQLRKYEYLCCKCGVQLICISEGKDLKLVILGENGEERND